MPAYGCSDEGDGDGKEGTEITGEWERVEIAGLLYADDLVLCGELEEDLKRMRRGLKFNVDKTKVMVLNGEDGLECKAHTDWIYLGHVSEFKYLGCILDESGTNGAECSRKVLSGRMVADVITSQVTTRDLQLQYARVLHEILLVPVLLYGSEIMLWKENERSRIRAVQMENLRGLLGIRKRE